MLMLVGRQRESLQQGKSSSVPVFVSPPHPFHLPINLLTSFLSSPFPRLRPLQRGEAIYDKGGLHTAVRRREQNRIVSENRAILQRIKSGKNTRSFYDHNVMARQEKERSRHIKNISKSYQREVRVKKAAARRRIMQSSMPTVFAPSGASMDSSGYGQIMDSSMKISLHTAKQIREDVATQRGLPLPDLMSRRPGDKGPAIGGMGGGSVVGVRRSVNQEESMQSKFTISHTGAPGGKGGEEGGGGLTGFGFENSFANMSLDGGGPGSEEGFADYDYGSAEGGEFKGRGYSAASGNRPGTTAQSARSQISKE